MKISISKSLGLFASSLVFGLSVQANAANGDVVVSGKFKGTNGHITKGSVMVVEMNGGHVIKLGENFSLDGAPDPSVAFVASGQKPVIVSALKSNSGAQTYVVPADLDPSNYDKFYIWCNQYSVSLGETNLK
jgi:hypothetical protein